MTGCCFLKYEFLTFMGLLCLDIVPCYDWKGGSVLNKDFTLISIKITSDCFLNEIQTKVKKKKSLHFDASF